MAAISNYTGNPVAGMARSYRQSGSERQATAAGTARIGVRVQPALAPESGKGRKREVRSLCGVTGTEEGDIVI